MLPQSYDHVSEETKQTVQLFIARASGYLQGKGYCNEEIEGKMTRAKRTANRKALDMAVASWKELRRPCTAERWVQWFADHLWDTVTPDHDRIWPYEFTTPVHQGPLSIEFLEATGITEAEAGGRPQFEKEKTQENDQSIDKEQLPLKRRRSAEEVKQPKHLETIFEVPKTLKKSILNALGVGGTPAWDVYHRWEYYEVDDPSSKRQRGNDGEEVPSDSFTKLPAPMDWPGAPLTADQVKDMNAGLMETIWETRIYDGDNIYHDAGPFAVKIPKKKARLVLGEHFNHVLFFIHIRWDPIELYTCDLGHDLQVGLWVSKFRSHEQLESNGMVRYKLEELYNILRHWSFQVQGRGTQSLVDCLVDYLKHTKSR